MKTSLLSTGRTAGKLLSLTLALGISSALHAQNPITFSGTVFQDGNGGSINGVPVGKLTMSPNASSQLYVYLLANTSGNAVLGKAVVDTAAATRGHYSINAQSSGNYNLRLSTTDVAVGTQNPSMGFPSSFVPMAEGSSLMGDGSPDFGASINATSPLIVNFAINARPEGLSYNIANPVYGANNQIIIPAVAFSASDQEDGTYPVGLAGRPIDLFQAAGGTLVYNGTAVNFAMASIATRISNFNPSLLKLEMNSGAGAFSFGYATVDDAGTPELAPNTISIGAAPLSVPLLSFEVYRKGAGAAIFWSASPEAGGLGFDVERSFNGRDFTVIGHVASATESNTVAEYRFGDGSVPTYVEGGKVYYRLRQASFGGSSEYSKVATLSLQATAEKAGTKFSMYPNPASTTLHLSLSGTETENAPLLLSDATGRIVARQTAQPDGNATIDVSALPAGVYFVQYRNANGTQTTERVSVTH